MLGKGPVFLALRMPEGSTPIVIVILLVLCIYKEIRAIICIFLDIWRSNSSERENEVKCIILHCTGIYLISIQVDWFLIISNVD